MAFTREVIEYKERQKEAQNLVLGTQLCVMKGMAVIPSVLAKPQPMLSGISRRTPTCRGSGDACHPRQARKSENKSQTIVEALLCFIFSKSCIIDAYNATNDSVMDKAVHQ